MAKVIIDHTPYEVPEGSPIAEVCERAGVPFSCNSGVCGSCRIQILAGAENLDAPTPEEVELGMEGDLRLACQCRIRTGEVSVTY